MQEKVGTIDRLAGSGIRFAIDAKRAFKNGGPRKPPQDQCRERRV